MHGSNFIDNVNVMGVAGLKWIVKMYCNVFLAFNRLFCNLHRLFDKINSVLGRRRHTWKYCNWLLGFLANIPFLAKIVIPSTTYVEENFVDEGVIVHGIAWSLSN